MTLSRRLACALAAALLALTTHAGVIRTLDGEKHAGDIRLDAGNWVVREKDRPEIKIPFDHTLLVVVGDESRPLPPPVRAILLTSGTLWAVDTIRDADARSLRARWADADHRIALLQIARIHFRPLPPELEAALPPDRPGALQTRGDFVDGTLARLEGDSVVISSVLLGNTRVGQGDLAAVALRPVDPNANAAFVVSLATGSQIHATAVRFAGGKVELDEPLLGKITVDPKSVLAVRAGPAKLAPLTRLTPRITPAPGRDPAQSFTPDDALTRWIAPASGIPAAPEPAAFAIACGTTLEYDLAHAYRSLSLRVRTPRGTVPGGRTRLVLLADGKEIARTPDRPSDDPTDLVVPLTGVKRLTIKAESPLPTPGPALLVSDAVLVRE